MVRPARSAPRFLIPGRRFCLVLIASASLSACRKTGQRGLDPVARDGATRSTGVDAAVRTAPEPTRPAARPWVAAPGVTPEQEQVVCQGSDCRIAVVTEQVKATLERRADHENLTLTFVEGTGDAQLATIANLPWVKHLILRRSRITSLAPLSHLPRLESLMIDHNAGVEATATRPGRSVPLDVSALGSLGALKEVRLFSSRLEKLAALRTATALQSLVVYDAQVGDLGWLSGHPNVAFVSLTRVRLGDLAPLGTLPGLRKLVLQNCQGISSVSGLMSASHLEFLSLNQTGADDLTGIARLEKLRHLRLNDTKVKQLDPLRGLKLVSLEVGRTAVSSLAALVEMESLEALGLEATAVTDLGPLARLRRLHTLEVSDTAVASLSPLAGHTRLKDVDLGSTKVADLSALQGCSGLESLVLSGTPVRSLAPLLGKDRLKTLRADRTQVTSLAPLAGLPALESLDLGDTAVADLGAVASLPRLAHLVLKGTQVRDVTPLRGHRTLANLSLYQTRVRDISALANLPRLAILNLFKTEVRDLRPLHGSRALETLMVTLENVSKEEVERLRKANGKVNVTAF
jgi:Leucine-rich repeat (LRR) protein